MTYLKTFGAEVRAARTKRRWTLTQLAHEALGNQERKSYVSAVENGKANLTPLTIQKFAKALKLPDALTRPLLGLATTTDDSPSQNEQDANSLLAATHDLSERLRISEAMAVALAWEYAGAQPGDLESALKELRRAFELAAKAPASTNIPSAVDTIMAEVRRLNAAGQIDAASDHLTRAIAAQKDKADEAAQAYRRLLAEGVDQAILSRDVDRVAALIVAGIEEDTPDPDARFAALRTVRREWYERGRDKGLAFDLEVSIALAQASLGMARTADDRGAARNDLGIALSTLGARESDPARLEQAVEAFRAALEEYTRDRRPLDWAATQNNLGNALKTLGERESNSARLEQAVAAYSAALEVRTREAMPLNWATTQNNLAYLERAFFDLTADPAHLDRAQAHLDLARAVFVNANATAYLESADRIQADINARRS